MTWATDRQGICAQAQETTRGSCATTQNAYLPLSEMQARGLLFCIFAVGAALGWVVGRRVKP